MKAILNEAKVSVHQIYAVVSMLIIFHEIPEKFAFYTISVRDGGSILLLKRKTC